ncbi:Hypothetical predicted protein, partial [Pelobates cultripes]
PETPTCCRKLEISGGNTGTQAKGRADMDTRPLANHSSSTHRQASPPTETSSYPTLSNGECLCCQIPPILPNREGPKQR